MNVNCWSENRQVTDTEELQMLSKLCQESTSAEIQLWWSLNLSWGDRPDPSVTAGKSESEVSALKAAACKECIAVINVRPMSLPLDTNMGHGSWNSGQTSEGITFDDIQNLQNYLANKSTTDFSNKDYDLNDDGVLNVFDLTIMKRQYVAKENEGRPVIEGEEGKVSIKDNKITFNHGIGKEMILEIQYKDCGGGCISFIETVDDNEYWVAYEWQTNDSGVVKIDMTKPNQVTLNDVKVDENGNADLYKKLGEKCMNETEANLFYWWAAQSWGNNYPDGTDLTHFEGRAFEEGKKIKTDIQENILFEGNQNKIDELIGILLDNALKYSDEESVIELDLHSEKRNIILTCKNKCKNFNPNDLSHLFERFYRGDKSHSERREGFGLGLAIAYEIVAVHNGNITADYSNDCVIFEIKLQQNQ